MQAYILALMHMIMRSVKMKKMEERTAVKKMEESTTVKKGEDRIQKDERE